MATASVVHDRLLNVDGLRLVCALAVLLFHFGFKGSLDGLYAPLLPWPAVSDAMKYGHIGVHIFFCISGFVIAYSASGRGALQFACARFARIYPTFALCLLLVFAVRLFWGGSAFPVSTDQLLANFTLVPQVFGQDFMSGVYWSIAVEIIFYGWVFLFLLLGLFDSHRLVIVALWLGVSTVNELALDSGALRLVLITEFAPYFVFGMLLQHAQLERRLTVETGGLMAWAVALGITVLLRETQDIRLAHGILMSDAVSVSVLLAGFLVLVMSVETQRPVLSAGLLLWAGGVSYPLYLLHEGVGQVAFVRLRADADGVLLGGVVALAVLAIASLIWLGFDRWVVPATRKRLLRAITGVVPRLAQI
jgi:peptidoglycan/LPS O-acetylase OafA/YrhL